MKNNNNVSVKINWPFFTLLGLLFIGLKLTGYITWPWWIVLAPIWGPVVLGILLFLILLAWVGMRKK